MSVDTHLKGKNLEPYSRVVADDVEILLSPRLTGWARQVLIDCRRFLGRQRFEILAEHRHAPT